MQTKSSPSVGCIGCGNMGGAFLAGLAERAGYTLYGMDTDHERIRPLISKGVRSVADAASLVRACSVVATVLKPHLTETVLREIRPHLKEEKVLLSLAAGISLSRLRAAVDGACPVVRVMPNTPALVGAGVFAVCLDDPALREDQKKLVMDIFSAIGLALEMPDDKFTAFTAVIGAGPAYVLYMMQSLTQAAVTMGFSWAEAARMINALFAGSARLAQNSKTSHSELADRVCSPAGVTIRGINYLDRAGVRGHIVNAALAAYMRGEELEREE
jgi:pyrroline-5-carboxylate reductase